MGDNKFAQSCIFHHLVLDVPRANRHIPVEWGEMNFKKMHADFAKNTVAVQMLRAIEEAGMTTGRRDRGGEKPKIDPSAFFFMRYYCQLEDTPVSVKVETSQLRNAYKEWARTDEGHLTTLIEKPTDPIRSEWLRKIIERTQGGKRIDKGGGDYQYKFDRDRTLAYVNDQVLASLRLRAVTPKTQAKLDAEMQADCFVDGCTGRAHQVEGYCRIHHEEKRPLWDRIQEALTRPLSRIQLAMCLQEDLDNITMGIDAMQRRHLLNQYNKTRKDSRQCVHADRLTKLGGLNNLPGVSKESLTKHLDALVNARWFMKKMDLVSLNRCVCAKDMTHQEEKCLYCVMEMSCTCRLDERDPKKVNVCHAHATLHGWTRQTVVHKEGRIRERDLLDTPYLRTPALLGGESTLDPILAFFGKTTSKHIPHALHNTCIKYEMVDGTFRVDATNKDTGDLLQVLKEHGINTKHVGPRDDFDWYHVRVPSKKGVSPKEERQIRQVFGKVHHISDVKKTAVIDQACAPPVEPSEMDSDDCDLTDTKKRKRESETQPPSKKKKQ